MRSNYLSTLVLASLATAQNECTPDQLAHFKQPFDDPELVAYAKACTSETEALEQADASGPEDLAALCNVEACEKLIEVVRDLLPQIPDCLVNGERLRDHELLRVESTVELWDRICPDDTNAASFATTGLGPVLVLGFVLAASTLGFAI